MIRGFVNARLEAIVRLRLRGPTGIELHVDAVVDTGHTASLALPTAIVAALGLVQHSSGSARLADGSICSYAICAAEVEWNGAWRPLLISAVGNEPLLGMQLLAGHQLTIEVKSSGDVAITVLP